MGWKIGIGAIFFCLLGFFGRAQHGASDYERMWAMVDSLERKVGRPVSALAEVNRIYSLARQERNSAEEIKALVLKVSLGEETSDDDTAGIRVIERQVQEAGQPARSILQSVLAMQYWRYLQGNRYRLYNRTATVGRSGKDFSTWTIDDFHRHIRELFLASLREDELLKRSSLKDWQPILLNGNTPLLRPTLFDLLAHEALGYFSSSETDINRPEQVYEVDDSAVFDDAAVFAAHVFTTADSSSPHYQALLLYQRLLRFHMSDGRPDALINVDIDRLDFAKDYSLMEDKGDRYFRGLMRLTGKWGNEPAAAQAWYLEAKYYSDQAKESAEKQDSAGWDGYVRAKQICEQVMMERDSSEGRINCRVLLGEIVSPTVELEVEQFNLPGKPFRCLLKWSNIDRIYLRLVRIDTMHRRLRWQQNEDIWQKWLKAPVYRSFTQELPVTADYREHAAEIAIGRLPPGTYALLSSTDATWDKKNSLLTGTQLIMTSMAYIRQHKDYFIVNRETGRPVSDTRAQVWKLVWNGNTQIWKPMSGQTYHTDQQGHFHLHQLAEYEERFLELQRPGEDVFLSELSLPYSYAEESSNVTTDKTVYERGNAMVYFFLDRGIYRPGQTVYFKGIGMTRDFDTRQLRPMAGRHARVLLTNANRERIDSLDLVADEFGAYHGVFHLPDHGLNGRFEISEIFGQQYATEFSVEEYKRPRFFVGFDPLKGSYRVGDSIRVHGSARAYAGNNLDGATVKYRITRLARYGYLRWFLPQRGNQEIGHGVLKTDGNGGFVISFSARADRSVPVASDTRFEYRISVDVTDINGETRSGATSVVAGYTVLDLSIGLERDELMLVADSLRSVRVYVTNLSGETVAAAVHVAAYPLAAPERLIRDRLWGTIPDRWVMTEQNFLDSFPHDPYREELKREKWVRGAAAWEGTDSTGGHSLALRLQPGWWVIEATATDSSGQPVKNTRYLQLLENATGEPVNPQYVWETNEERVTATPGGVARLHTGSSARDVYVVRAIRGPIKTPGLWNRTDDVPLIPVFQHFEVSGGANVTDWKITEAERGGFAVADAFVRDNRFYVHRIMVDVPWDNKKLDIRYTSFRDKTEPGSGEKWGVEIGGAGGSRAAAQVLAAMYDASLDQFVPHSWNVPDPYPEVSLNDLWEDIDDFRSDISSLMQRGEPEYSWPQKIYDRLIEVGTRRITHMKYSAPVLRNDAIVERNLVKAGAPGMEGKAYLVSVPDLDKDADGSKMIMKDSLVVDEPARPSASNQPPVQVRTNFRETAFFFPDLRTDSSGRVSFSFTMPESLTRWKWMTLAHTRDLSFGYSEKTIVTKKQLMVQPNVPRFLREGDKINFSVKVVNMTDSEMTGQIGLSLTDPTTAETADGWFVNRQPNQYFTVPARGSAVVEFPLDIPYQYNRPVSYRIVAQAGSYSDGEEAVLPVVSNRMMVTETLPLNMPADGVRSFTFKKLLESGNSETLNNHALTVEFTANPAWYAVQALPYLMEYPYECAEQTFDRLYANAVASKILSSSPRIAQVFARWKTLDTSALLSNLEKDQELKSVLLEETPWVLEGRSETQQKQHIALLFDMVRMSRELESTINRLNEVQAPDGGFPWFKGGPEDRYVTQYILTGLGRLQRLEALPAILAGKVKKMTVAALAFADKKIAEDYQQDLKVKNGVHWIEPLAAQYLYMRSFFSDDGIPGSAFPAVNFYRKVARQEWVKAGKYIQGLVALALFRTGDGQTAKTILASLRETAIRDAERGMYWKGMEGGYYWYQAPVETESLLIEAFREIGHDTAADRQLKTWLLRQKQTHQWPTTKATTDAVYALWTGGSDWLDQQRSVTVELGDKTVDWPAGGVSTEASPGEAGTGYDKKIFDAPFINPSMGHIKVTMSSVKGGGSPAWGAVYWQYFDQLDRITPADGGKTPLRVEKRLFVQRNTDRGPVLDTMAENGVLRVGDRVVVRLVLRTDRDLEYVHLKDMRGACFEPVNVLSGYQWQDGLGYYESTKDVSTEFFFSSVRRGTYVFEYPLIVEQTGEFSNGVASVECMYAPEFADHTEGIRVNVEGGQ